MSVLVFANGDIPEINWIKPYLRQAQSIIAADGGIRHLIELGHSPNIVVGDMDSVSRSGLDQLLNEGTEIISYPKKKDETDLELALIYAAEQFSTDILVFGSQGGRMDQTLGNILLLVHPMLQGQTIKLIEPKQCAWLVEDSTEIEGAIGDIVSLIPLGSNVLVHETRGLQWALNDEWLLVGATRGLSNVMTAKRATIALKSGRLICVQTVGDWKR